MLLSLVSLLLACPRPQPAPTPTSVPDEAPTPVSVETDQDDDAEALPGAPETMAPHWGEGPIEIWQGDDMVGVSFVEKSGTDYTEHVAMFTGTLTANNATRWDAALDGMSVYPPYIPSTASGSVGDALDIRPWKKCTAKDSCADCGQTSCFTDFTDFKSKVWTQLAQRLGKTKAQVESVSKDYAGTDSFSRGVFSTSACTAPTGTEYSPPRNNGLKRNGSLIGSVHMGIDGSDSSKTWVRQAISSQYQSLPWAAGTFTQDESALGTGGPWGLSDWCDEVDSWCGTLPTGTTCIYTEMKLTYANSW